MLDIYIVITITESTHVLLDYNTESTHVLLNYNTESTHVLLNYNTESTHVLLKLVNVNVTDEVVFQLYS
jgi:phenylpyruvate tautomerase PptA (4-oxalocrotonate tautomerase family)